MLLCLAVGLTGFSDAKPHRSIDERITATIKADAAAMQHRGNVEQARVLADGVVTQSEYDHLWSLYRRCVEGIGLTVGNAIVNPFDGRTYILDVDPSQRVDGKQMASCQERYVSLVDVDVAERPKPMPVPLRRALRKCLESKGISVPATARDNRDFSRAAGDAHVPELGACVDQTYRALYPNIPYLSWHPTQVS